MNLTPELIALRLAEFRESERGLFLFRIKDGLLAPVRRVRCVEGSCPVMLSVEATRVRCYFHAGGSES